MMAARKGKGGGTEEPPSDGVTRARSRTPPTKPERVRLITEMMANGTWVRGVTGPELAANWGLSLKCLEQDAAEASRHIQSLFSDEEKQALKAEFLAELQADKRACRTQRRLEALGRLQDIYGKAIGAFSPLELTGKGGKPIDLSISSVADLLAMSDEGSGESE